MKRTKRNKFLAALLTLGMMSSMCRITAFAETDYEIRINHGTTSTLVTSSNAADVLGDGTVSYDADTNTLTLDNANLTYVNPGEAVISVYDDGEALNLNLVGQNTITAERCIYVKPDLVITGEGHLEMQSTLDALYASNNLTIDGPTVNAKVSGGNITGTFTAIKANQGILTIKNSKNVSASNPTGTGISGSGGVEIVNSHVAASTGYSFALVADGKGLTITDSAVDVFNSNGVGMFASAEEGGIKISRSTVSATTTGESTYSIGTNYNVIEISDSKVTVASEGLKSNGIFAGGSLLICDQSNVTAFGTYPAMHSETGTTISDSTVVAVSSDDTAISSWADISVEAGAQVTATTDAAQSNGIYTEGGVSILGKSNVTAHGTYPAVYSETGTTISDSTVVAFSSDDAALFSKAVVRVENGADVTADGYWAAIHGNEEVSISDSKMKAVSREDIAIFAPGILTITDSIVEADGYWAAIRGNQEVSISDSKMKAVSREDVAIFAPESLTITDSIVEAKGKSDLDGIKANNTVEVSGSWISTSGNETFAGSTDYVLINKVAGTVIGNAVLPDNVTIPADTTIHVPSDSSLTIPENVTLTNDGTVNVEGEIIKHGIVICNNHNGGTATCTAQAVCDLCGQAYGSPNGHKMQKIESKEPTCTESGNMQYWHCTVCDKNFADEQAAQELDNVGVPATGHTLEKVDAKTPTCTESGNVDYWHCAVCDKNFADEQAAQELDNVSVPATGHSLKKVDAKEPTCTESGNVDYWHCAVCDKDFADEQSEEELSDTEISALGHKAEKVEAKEPTATTPGNIEHWYCSQCGQYFKDADLTEIILKEDTVLGATGVTPQPKPEQPDNPSNPTEPPKESHDIGTTGAVQTGDHVNLMLWVVLIGIGMTGIIGTVHYRAKKKS